MYTPVRDRGLISLAELSRFFHKDPRTIKLEAMEKGFPKKVFFGKRYYWEKAKIEKYYGVKIP